MTNKSRDLHSAACSGAEIESSAGISRRQFVAGATAIGLTASGLLSSPSASRASTPRTGGTLRVGIGHGSSSDTLDPATWSNNFIQVLGRSVYNSITEIDNNNQVAPGLAESWEPVEGGKKWVFDLRKGVEFHNGKTLDSGDVVASIRHHMGPDSKSGAKPILDQVAEIESDGPNRVIFTLSGRNSDFPALLSDYHLMIMPTLEGKVDPSGIGTGGYVLDHFTAGVRARVTRSSNYWRADSAYFDAAEIISIADVAARMNALITDEVDVIDRPDLKTLHLLKRDQRIRVEEVQSARHYTFAMHTDTVPFESNDIRLALKYGIDRQELLKTVLNGHGSLGNDHPISPAYRYYADLEQRQYDPDRAKFHLQKAGLQTLTVDLSTADAAFPGAVDAAVLYKERAARAGIDINVVREPTDGYWSNVWLKKPFCAVFWGGRSTVDWMLSTVYYSGVPWNDTRWSNPKFDSLLIAAREELDEAKRRDMYAELQLIVRDEGGAIVPLFANHVFCTRTRVGYGKVAGSADLDGLECVERWWFNE